MLTFCSFLALSASPLRKYSTCKPKKASVTTRGFTAEPHQMSLNNPQRIYTNTNALNISTLQHPNVRINVNKNTPSKKKQRKNPTSFVNIFKPRGSSIEDHASFQ